MTVIFLLKFNGCSRSLQYFSYLCSSNRHLDTTSDQHHDSLWVKRLDFSFLLQELGTKFGVTLLSSMLIVKGSFGNW